DDERAGLVGLAAGLPIGPQLDANPITEQFRRSVIRNIELHLLVADQEKRLGIIKCNLARKAFAEEAGRVIDPRAGRDVGLLSLEHGLCFVERLAALPALRQSRVAAVGQRAGTEIGSDVESVLVAPGGVALGLGKLETVVDELLGLDIELALD